jgi:chorismate mutase
MNADITATTPTSLLDRELDLVDLDCQLERLDQQLVELIVRRVAVTRQRAEARAAVGRTAYHHAHELSTVARYDRLGPVGHEIAVLLLRLAR